MSLHRLTQGVQAQKEFCATHSQNSFLFAVFFPTPAMTLRAAHAHATRLRAIVRLHRNLHLEYGYV